MDHRKRELVERLLGELDELRKVRHELYELDERVRLRMIAIRHKLFDLGMCDLGGSPPLVDEIRIERQ